MADDTTTVHQADPEHGEHDEIHLPPNSYVPINIALSLATIFVGFVDQVRGTLGPVVWGVGLIWFIATCAAWVRAARNEYAELPDSLDSH